MDLNKALTPCPVCGVPMNHHADKMVYVEGCGPVHEVLEEFYRCPNCGAAAARVPGQGEQGSS